MHFHWWTGPVPRYFLLGLMVGLTIAFLITSSHMLSMDFTRTLPSAFMGQDSHPKDISRITIQHGRAQAEVSSL